MNARWKARVRALALGLLLLAVWEAAARGLALSALVLPPPSAVAEVLWRSLIAGQMGPHFWATLIQLSLGLAAGGLIGFGAGLALHAWPVARALLMPYVVISQVVPKLALMPLFIVWFGFGLLPTVVVTALICFFPLLENTLLGLSQVPAERLALFRMLGATPWQTLRRLKLPTALPAILAGLRVAVVLAVVGAVVGEFIAASRGLGALIIAAQGTMDTPLMFAALVMVSALGMALYTAVLWLEKRLLAPYQDT